MSEVEDTLAYQISAVGLQKPEREYRFDPKRRFRADFAYPGLSLLIEVEGGIWKSRCKKCKGDGCRSCDWTGFSQGRHARGGGYESDCRKYNHAGLLGFTVLRFTPGMVESGEAVRVIERALGTASARPRVDGER